MDFLADDAPRRDDPRVVETDAVPLVDLSDEDAVHPDVGIRPIDEVLGLEEMGAKLWYFEPGEEVGFHAHPDEEEFYYVLAGEFSLKLGDPDDPTYAEVGPETFFAARPLEPHGHRCIGDDRGIVLAIGAPGDASGEVVDPNESMTE